jgi:adenine phosphoribosyltransferase
MHSLKDKIRGIPDFPKPGILFYDVTTLLRDPAGFRQSIDAICEPYEKGSIDLVAGIESRGFILGAAMADRLGAGFVPIRKAGKLPGPTISESYALEYGNDTLEIHDNAIQAGQRVLIVDDLLATGGTAGAVLKLVRRLGGDVQGLAFLVELAFLPGRERLAGEQLHVVVRYDE